MDTERMMMESVDFMDSRLNPPGIPEFAECDKCHDKFHADDLNDGICDSCLQYIEACEQERE